MVEREVKTLQKQTIIGQKIKGKFQKFKGEVEMRTGSSARGIVDKTKGALNDGISDFRTALTNTSNE